MTTKTMPKSYFPEAEREGLTQNGIYLAESLYARKERVIRIVSARHANRKERKRYEHG